MVFLSYVPRVHRQRRINSTSPAVENSPVGATASSAPVKLDLQLTVPMYGVFDIPLTPASDTATLHDLQPARTMP
jgi:hypothetical protein